MCLKSPVTWTSTLVGRSTWPAGSCCLCYFWQAVRHHTDLHPGRNVYLTSWFILSVLFLTDHETSVVRISVSDSSSQGLHPGRNIYLISWVILSVLFLTGGETSVVPTPVQVPHHTELHPGRNVYLTSWFILSVLFFTGNKTSVVPTHVQDPLSHGPPPW